MRLPVAIGIALGDADVEVVLDFVDEADRLSGKLAAGGQRAQVRADVVGSGGGEVVIPGHLRQRRGQPVGLSGQFGGVRSRF